MRIALLGADAESTSLLTEAADLGHQIAWTGDLGDFQQVLQPWGNLTDESPNWEVLLDRDFCDAVIVGRGTATPELRLEQLLQLMKQEISVLTTFPLTDSLLSYYEIDMARSETRALLQHFNPLVEHSDVLERCRAWITQGHLELGAVEQVVWQRSLQQRSRSQVLWWFARDVEVLDKIAGRLNRLGALGSPNAEVTYAGLSVQLLGESQVPVRWEVRPAQRPEDEAASLTIIAHSGRVTFVFDDTGERCRQIIETSGETTTGEVEIVESARETISRFLADAQTANGKATTWPDALRAVELTDTIEISLRRGRMIEVHNQQLTEELSFKGTMSAVGCGVLLVLAPLLLLLGWIAELVGLPVASYWPHVLLALLVIFLLFQLLPRLLMRSEKEQKQEEVES